MAGVKGRSGRKRNPANVQKYFNEQFDLCSGSLVQTLIDKAKNGDRELLIYCFDRRLGKPKQQVDIDPKGMQAIGMSTLLELYQLIAAERKQLTRGEVVEGECKEV